MDVQVGIPVRDPDGRRVYVIEPVVGRHLPGCIQYQAAQGVSLIGIGLDAFFRGLYGFLQGGNLTLNFLETLPEPVEIIFPGFLFSTLRREVSAALHRRSQCCLEKIITE